VNAPKDVAKTLTMLRTQGKRRVRRRRVSDETTVRQRRFASEPRFVLAQPTSSPLDTLPFEKKRQDDERLDADAWRKAATKQTISQEAGK
jgi:hypothetical protein